MNDSAVVGGIPVSRLLEEAPTLGLRLQVGRGGLDRCICDAEVQKPGLVLAGVQPSHARSVHVLGQAEMDYLAVRGRTEQRRVITEYVRAGVPCVVICRGIAPSPVIREVADESGIPVFTTLRPTGEFMRNLHAFLEEALAPRQVLHAVLVQVHHAGVLLTGESGVGKSEAALELILRGHRLVADDLVELRGEAGGVVGCGRPPLGHYMEIRGLGVLHAGDLFGQAAVVGRAQVHLNIELVSWASTEQPDRTGLEDRTVLLLGHPVPAIRLPVRPGRNVATLIEVAVRNQILKSRGVHSARRFAEELDARLREQK